MSQFTNTTALGPQQVITDDVSLLTAEMHTIAQDMVQQQRELVGEMNHILQQMQSLIAQQGGDLNVLNQLVASTLSKQQQIMTGNNTNATSVAAVATTGANNISPEPSTILNAWRQSLDIMSRLKAHVKGDDVNRSFLDQIQAKLSTCDYITSKEFLYLNTLMRDNNNNNGNHNNNKHIADEVHLLLQHIDTMGLYSCDRDRDFLLRLLNELKSDPTPITEDGAFPLLLCTIERSVSERKVLSRTQVRMLRYYVQPYDEQLMTLVEEKLYCMNLIPEKMLQVTSQSSPSSQSTFHACNETLRIAVKQWLADKDAALLQYGHISTWDTSEVTDMKELFKNRTFMNYKDIKTWDLSNVTDLKNMFHGVACFDKLMASSKVSDTTC